MVLTIGEDEMHEAQKQKAPIALFAYKRPWHTQQTLESLAANEVAVESELFIFCDGPKRPEDAAAVEEVRRLVKSRQWCGKVNVIERDKNLGLANSIISGVTELCNKYGRVIVLEDDLLFSRYFLKFLNTALDKYENEERIMQIAGHLFPVDLKADTDAVFMPMTTSLGWGTWQRAWKHFDAEGKGYEILKADKIKRRRFDLNESYPYFAMLEKQRLGQVDSWAIRWYLSVFMHNGMTLFPSRTLIEHIGYDGSGTHSSAIDKEFYGSLSSRDFTVKTFPLTVNSNEIAFKEYKAYFKTQRQKWYDIVRDFIVERIGLDNALL